MSVPALVELEWAEQALRDAWQDALSRMKVPYRFSAQVPVTLRIDPTLAGWSGFEIPSDKYPKGRPWAVTYLGPAGTGKTWAAVRQLGHSFGNHARAKDYAWQRSRFVTASDLVREIQSEFGSDRAGEFFQFCTTCPCLLLDDLGAERKTDFVSDTVNQVLHTRYNRMLPVIVTSNVETADALYKELDPRIADRLSEGRVYELTGSSRREAR